MRIRTKLILLLIALAIAILLAAGVFTTITLDNYLKSRVVSEMGRQADEFAYVVQTAGYGDSSGYRHLQQLAHAADLRLTLITEDGKVVFESDLPPAQLSQLENHLHRPEIQQALKEGAGVST